MDVRVAHLTPSFGCGGLERVIANLINHSPEHIKHTVISLSDDTSFSHALPDHVECISIRKKPGLDPLVHWRAIQALKKCRADVLHTYNFGALEHHWSARLAGIKKHVHSDHGLGGDHPEGMDQRHNLFRRWVSRYIDHYVVVSKDLRTWVTETVGVPSKKVDFIFNGVTVPPFQPAENKPSGRLRLVIVGRLAEVKNHQRLFEAIQIARRNPHLDITCDIVGDGPLMDTLKASVDTLCLQESIQFHGLQTDVRSYIEQSDALILSSDYEAMPMTVLEAMAYSRPVICPDVGGVRDFLSDEHALIPKGRDVNALADAIVHYANCDEEALIEQVKRAHQLTETHYSVKAMVERYQPLYEING